MESETPCLMKNKLFYFCICKNKNENCTKSEILIKLSQKNKFSIRPGYLWIFSKYEFLEKGVKINGDMETQG